VFDTKIIDESIRGSCPFCWR